MTTGTFFKALLLTAGLLYATAFQAAAQGGGGGGGGGGGRGGMGGILTQEQRQSMRDSIQADLTPLTEKLVAAQKEAVTAVLNKSSDAVIKEKIAAVQAIQTDIAMLRIKALKSITLTEDQKAQLKEARDGGYNALVGGMGGFGGRAGGGARRGNNQ
jgi:Spy/CpxP family protein refolding chaperone